MQMSDGVAAVSDRYQSISSDGVSTMRMQRRTLKGLSGSNSTDDPRFGPQKEMNLIQYMNVEPEQHN